MLLPISESFRFGIKCFRGISLLVVEMHYASSDGNFEAGLNVSLHYCGKSGRFEVCRPEFGALGIERCEQFRR